MGRRHFNRRHLYAPGICAWPPGKSLGVVVAVSCGALSRGAAGGGDSRLRAFFAAPVQGFDAALTAA